MKLEEIERTLPAEKEWWEKRRAAIEAELLGEPQRVPVPAAAKTNSAAPGAQPIRSGDAAIVDSTNQATKKTVASK